MKKKNNKIQLKTFYEIQKTKSVNGEVFLKIVETNTNDTVIRWKWIKFSMCTDYTKEAKE